MPRYYFDRINGSLDPDTDGSELLDIGEAKREAVAFAAGTLKDLSSWESGELRIEVLDDARTVIFAVSIIAGDVGKLRR